MNRMLRILKTKKAQVIIALSAIVLLGGILRMYKLGANPFIADEFIDMNSAYAYRMTDTWQAWDFNFGTANAQDVNMARDVRAWLYKWQVAQVLRVVAPTEENARLVSVLWGLLSIVLIYGVAVSFTKNRTVGLMSAFLFAVSAIGIMFDRKLRMYAMFYPVYLTLSWCFYKFLEQQYIGRNKIAQTIQMRLGVNIVYAAPLILVGLLSFHLQLLTANIFPTVLIYMIAMAVILRAKQGKWHFNKYIAYASLGVVGAALAVVYLPQYTGIFTASIKFFIDNQGYFGKILSDYSNSILAILLFSTGVWYVVVVRKLTTQGVWLASGILVPLLMAAFMWKRTQGIQYIFFAQSFLIILLACGIYGAADFIRTNFTQQKESAYAFTLAVLLLLLPNYGYFFEADNAYHRGDVADYRKVLQYVKRNIVPGDVIITRNFRNYYLSGLHAPVIDFGGEAATSDFSLAQLQQTMQQYPQGWLVLFDNDDDFLSKEARQYAEKNFKKVDNSFVRGPVQVYQWGR